MRYRVYVLNGIALLLMMLSLSVKAVPTVETLQLAGGKSMHVLYDTPEHPIATLVMLPGGTGRIGVLPDGQLRYAHEFTVRTRAEWVARGYAVIIPDTPNRMNLRGYRHTSDYAQALATLLEQVQQRSSRPIFLIGASQGAIAAVNAAAHLSGITGIVLAEAVSIKGRSGETVFDASPGEVRVPVLIVTNKKDGCWVAPPSHVALVADALQRSIDVQRFTVEGGQQYAARACSALSPHGYKGIETDVIDGIQHWIEQLEAVNAHSEV